MIGIGVQCERDDALRDIQAMCEEYGTPITVRLRKETDVRRDEYGSVKSRPTETDEFEIGVFPFIPNPNRRDLEKAGLREYAEGVAYTATKDWTDKGWSFDDINAERMTIVRGETQYRIVEKTNHSPFADAFLYIILNLKRL